jgi:hypothetical protein
LSSPVATSPGNESPEEKSQIRSPVKRDLAHPVLGFGNIFNHFANTDFMPGEVLDYRAE